MAAAKAQNQRRRPPQKQRGNVQKFKQATQKRVNMRPNMGGIGAMFNSHQMMDNPGYMDFNEPAIRPPMGNPTPKVQKQMVPMQRKQNRPMVQQQQRRRQQMPPQRPQGGAMGGGGNMGGGGGGGWGNQQVRMPTTPPNMNQRPGPPGPPFRGGPMPPRMHPPMGPNMPPFHPPPMNGRFMGFGPRPGPPMPPPMGQWPPMGMPRPMPGAMGPPRPLMGGGRPNNANPQNNRMRRQQNTQQKPQRKPTKANKKMKPGVKKPNHQPQNLYPLEEPWVTPEIREQHQKKQDLQNQLKGNRNDELFARFKSERDKFVALYDAAKAEFNKTKSGQVSSTQ